MPEGINGYHHSVLAGMRTRLGKAGKKAYVLPSAGLFRFVVCPHYLGELVAWYGISTIGRGAIGWGQFLVMGTVIV